MIEIDCKEMALIFFLMTAFCIGIYFFYLAILEKIRARKALTEYNILTQQVEKEETEEEIDKRMDDLFRY